MVMLWDSIRITHIKMSLVITQSIVRVPIQRVKVPIVPGVKTDNKLKLQTWAREISQLALQVEKGETCQWAKSLSRGQEMAVASGLMTLEITQETRQEEGLLVVLLTTQQ